MTDLVDKSIDTLFKGIPRNALIFLGCFIRYGLLHLGKAPRGHVNPSSFRLVCRGLVTGLSGNRAQLRSILKLKVKHFDKVQED